VGDADFGATRIAFAFFVWPVSPFLAARSLGLRSAGEERPNMSIAYPEDDRFLRGLIRRKVDQLIRRPGFDPQDRHDFETDLLLRVLQSLPAYDPLKSHPYVFFTTVVERYVANLVRNRSVAKRDDSGIWSLNVTVHLNKEEVTELAQEVGERELSSRTGW
jgi:DNA-directed RNA polymerase specialized sigma24 family protein